MKFNHKVEVKILKEQKIQSSTWNKNLNLDISSQVLKEITCKIRLNKIKYF